MFKKLLAILFLCLLPVVAFGQSSSASPWKPSAGYLTPVNSTWGLKIPALTNCDTIDTDAAGVFSCGTDNAGAGAMVLDLADDASNESTALAEIATSGDTNSIFTEPAADKLLIDLSKDWPKSDLADALNANGSNCSAGSGALGVDAAGAAESCTDFEEDLSNSAGLAGALSDETGTDYAVFSTSPTIWTPTIWQYDAAGIQFKTITSGYLNFIASYAGAGGEQRFQAQKSRGTIASPAVVVKDDNLGRFMFDGYDGDEYVHAAEITAIVDNTPGNNDMPGAIIFGTTENGENATAERMRIDSANGISFGPAGVKFSNDEDGAITLLGLGDGNDEDLTLNFDDTANEVDITSSTGVLDVDFNTIDINTDTVDLTGTGTINGLDAIDATGESTLEATLDIAGDVSSTGMSTTVIGADKVLESHLKAVDAASDEECLTYEATGGDFEWQSCGAGAGDITDVGDCASGACLDGTSDGGTYISFYDADGAAKLQTGNTAGAITLTLPNTTGTIALTTDNVSTASALAANGANCDAGSAPLGVDASGAAEGCFAVQASDADLTTWAGITPGANVGTFLSTPSSANFTAALTDEDGTGTCGTGAVCIGGHTHPTTEVSGVNAGTDLTADLEEEVTEGSLADSTITAAEIKDGTILEADLKAVDSASDEECLTYETTTGDFEWQSCSTGIASTDIDTSAELYGILTDETGSASGTPLAVFNVNPTLTGATLAGILADDDDMVFEADANNNGSNKFSFTDGASSEIASITEAGLLTIADDLVITGSDLSVGTAGVKLTGDGDGALTLLGLGNGYDEDITFNLDDTENTLVLSSSTGLATIDIGTMALEIDEGKLTDSTIVSADVKDNTLTASDMADSLDFGGDTSFEIPNAAGPTVDAAGEIAVDTTSDQLIYYGGAKRVIAYAQEKCFSLEDPTDDDDNIAFFFPRTPITITDVYCEIDGGTSVSMTISDGTNALEAITCDGDGAQDDGSIANGTFTTLERIEFDLASTSGTNTWLYGCITYNITAD